MRQILHTAVTACCLLAAGSVCAQPVSEHELNASPAHLKANRLLIYDSSRFEPFFSKMQRLLVSGDEQIHIVHIGDSHLQADIFSQQVRTRLQTWLPGGNGGRGFVFPYSMAHTNNPWNYKVAYTGSWSSCRNTQAAAAACNLGMAGITVSTRSPEASFSLAPAADGELKYDITHIELMYSDPACAYEILLGDGLMTRELADDGKLKTWESDNGLDTIHFRLLKRENAPADAEITIYGILMGTSDPGVVYHAMGVNGATVAGFLKCDLLAVQLKQLHPDLIILSLGTNDAYTNQFDSDAFEAQYATLVRRIRKYLPETPILFTAPGDNYYRRGLNYSNGKAIAAIKRVCRKNGDALWDWHAVMGGTGSVEKWHRHGLTAGDRVHLTAKGYRLQGDLLFTAITQAFESYVRRLRPTEN